MRITSFLGLSSLLIGGFVLATTACGEDKGTVLQRVNGTGDGGIVVSEGGTGCGVAIPENYVTSDFNANAAVELAFAQHISDLDLAMTSTEGASTNTTTATDLDAIFNAGSPSLRSVSTTDAQTMIDSYLTAFGVAESNTSPDGWVPTEDGGTSTGGKYEKLFYESPEGVDIRQAIDNVVLGGALYNHVLGLVAAPITDVSTDQLVAAWGATPALANSTLVDAGINGDTLVAGLASNRGLYSQMKMAILTMKADILAGDRCKADLANATQTFLLGWEQTIYASAIYYLNAASTNATETSASSGALALHSFGNAIGLVQSFKGLPASNRKITDAQIDTVFSTMLGNTPYEIVTNAGASILAIENAISLIQLYEGFTDAEVATFKSSF